MFSDAFIKANANLFLTTDWVKASKLRAFIGRRGNSRGTPFILSSSPPPETLSACNNRQQTPIKAEVNADVIDLITPPRRTRVKPEPIDAGISESIMGIRTRSAFKNDTEVLEILDSDEEMDVDREDNGGYISDDDGIASMPLQTDWQDDDVTSRMVCEKTKLTRQLEVERIEYLTEIPSVWPVPRVATAYVLDLRDAKFHVSEKGKILTADALIKNKVRPALTSHSEECLPSFRFLGPRFVGRNHGFCRQ
jgi:hypothetical protein